MSTHIRDGIPHGVESWIGRAPKQGGGKAVVLETTNTATPAGACEIRVIQHYPCSGGGTPGLQYPYLSGRYGNTGRQDTVRDLRFVHEKGGAVVIPVTSGRGYHILKEETRQAKESG